MNAGIGYEPSNSFSTRCLAEVCSYPSIFGAVVFTNNFLFCISLQLTAAVALFVHPFNVFYLSLFLSYVLSSLSLILVLKSK